MKTLLVDRDLTYEEFRQSMGNLCNELPEILTKDFLLFFCPERCPLHPRASLYQRGMETHNFGTAQGNCIFICYDAFKTAHRFEERHCWKVLYHEIEHAVNPSDHHHSEHVYR